MAGEVYEFYIKNYLVNGSLNTSETRIQTIPITGDPVFSDSPSIKNELGKAGSFEFKLESNSPYYNSLIQMKTLFRVTYFGVTIFRGRVLTIGKGFKRSRVIHCEGDLAFLLDSHQIGTKEETRPEIGVYAYLQQIINQHNADCSDEPDKQFVLGEVPGHYSSAQASQRVNIPADKATQKFGDTSWNTSMDRLEGLLSDFGGYFRTRYDVSNGITYLDWLDKYYRTSNSQGIEITKNLIDLDGPTEVDNLFTVVVPIGKDSKGNEVHINDYWPIAHDGHAKVDHIWVYELATLSLCSDAELNSDYHRKIDYQNSKTKFGAIWKPVSFENADTPEKLFNYCVDWIKNNYMAEITQWSVTALDLKIVDPSKQYILCGDKIPLSHPEVEQLYSGLTVISAEYNPYKPNNNKYTIGIPNQEINSSYGVKNKTGGKGGGGGLSSKKQDDNEKSEMELEIEKLKRELDTQYWLKTKYQQDITYDNPLAYQVYNTNMTTKDNDQQTAIKNMIDTANAFMETRRTKLPELIAEAVRRGVPLNDPQLLIDFTPSEKRKQQQFKSQATNYLVNTVGMTLHQADMIVNETESQSFLSKLVNDDGSWSDYAISKGATVWNDNIRQQAYMTKQIYNGKKTTSNSLVNSAAKAYNYFADLVSGKSLNIGNNLNVDEIINNVTGKTTKVIQGLNGKLEAQIQEKDSGSGSGIWNQTSINLMDILTGNDKEDGGKEYEITSDTSHIDGSNGKAQFGTDGQGNWKIKLNELVTYQDEGGVSHTLDGFVCANDFNIPEIASFKTKLLVVDELIAGKATIGELNAAKARISTLEADAITANNLAASIARINNLSVQNVAATSLRFSTGTGVYADVKNSIMNIQLVEVTGGYQIWGVKFNGEIVKTETFSRAGSLNLSASWGSGKYTVLNNDVEVLSTQLQYLSPNGDISKVNKSVQRLYNVMYGPDEDHLSNTGFSQTVAMDASSVYDDGWTAARAKLEWPGDGSTASMGIKYPPSIVDGDAITRTYTISDDGKNGVKLTGGGNTVAKYTHGKYNAGWAAAIAKLGWPGAGTASSFRVYYPPSTVDGNADYKAYALANKDDDTVKLTNNGTTIAEYNHGKYTAGVTAGKNAVGLQISTSDAKIKRNQSSNALTEVQISLDLGSVNSNGQRTVKVKANTTDLLSQTLADYKNGYLAGATSAGESAWFAYTSSAGSSSSFIDISTPSTTRHLYIFYTDGNGNRVNRTGQTWYLPKAQLFRVNSQGSHNQGTLPSGSYVCAGYTRGGYAGDAQYSDYTWKVGGGSSSYTMRCTSAVNEGGTVRYTFQMSLSASSSGFSTGTSYTFYR